MQESIYLMDVKNLIYISYFLGATNDGENLRYSGIAFTQLAININEDYKYIQNQYYNF